MALTVEQTKSSWIVTDDPPQFSASGATGTVHWATNRGSMPEEIGPDNLLSMPNESWYGPENAINGNQAVKITVNDDVTTVSLYVDVYAVFPYQADWGFQSMLDEDTEISRAEDNSESYRILSGLHASWPMVFKDREHVEFIAAQRFRAFHGKTRWFYIQELGLEELQYVRFDSGFNRQPDWADGKTYGFTLYTNQWGVDSTTPPVAGGTGVFGDITPGDDLFGG